MRTPQEKRLYEKAYRARNKQRILARQKQWYYRMGKEEWNKKQRAYRKKHKETIRIYNREYQRQYLKDTINHDKHRARMRNLRAKLKSGVANTSRELTSKH